jgi:tetratricopeptide (TPR) repeat protein
MANTARILRFPSREAPKLPLSEQEAYSAAATYLGRSRPERDVEFRSQFLSDPDVVAAICSLLERDLNSAPEDVAEEACELYAAIDRTDAFRGLFDERKFFLGEAALLAAAAMRIVGRREETDVWLLRAEAGFRDVINPAPKLASLSYVRLALLYDRGRFQDVIDLSPALISSCHDFGMTRDHFKAVLLRATALKMVGDFESSSTELKTLLNNPVVVEDAQMHARVLIDIGDIAQNCGQPEEALSAFQMAVNLVRDKPATANIGELRLQIGVLLRGQGKLSESIGAFREAIGGFADLGMATRVSFSRILLAEGLLADRRYREAEWEILAALPTIEEQQMVPEGFAAVALLKESVRRRKTDPNALRELREHLQANQ